MLTRPYDIARCGSFGVFADLGVDYIDVAGNSSNAGSKYLKMEPVSVPASSFLLAWGAWSLCEAAALCAHGSVSAASRPGNQPKLWPLSTTTLQRGLMSERTCARAHRLGAARGGG